MSFGVEFALPPEDHEDANKERVDLVDPTAPNLSLPSGTFLIAAVALKDQVHIHLSSSIYLLLTNLA